MKAEETIALEQVEVEDNDKQRVELEDNNKPAVMDDIDVHSLQAALQEAIQEKQALQEEFNIIVS